MKKIIYFIFLSIVVFSCEKKDTETIVAEKPNIVFIMADDHAIHAISAYGNEIGKMAPTPNIDRIAEEGVIFNGSYCTNSICGPSRAVILTGNHSHINGFRQNGDVFNGDQPTLPKMLKSIGYETALVGKWHLDGLPQGFDYWDILKDQGNYYNPDFIHPSENNSSKIDTIVVEGYATDLITKKSINWLKNRNSKEKDKPFYLMVHHKAPHRNWMPALRHVNKFDSINFPLPDTYFTEHKGSQASKDQLQTIYKDMYEGHDLKMTKEYGSSELVHNPWTNDFDRMTAEQRKAWDIAYQQKNDAFHKLNLMGIELAKWKFQRYLQEYLATIAAVDEGVGEILNYLKETGLDKNTIVVYTSDQGFYLGEKGWFDKRYMYEESFRMPLLMKFPNRIKPGTETNALVQNLDFAPTFLDYANANELNSEMQGKSFKPLLDGNINDDDFRDVIYYHYYDYPAFHMVKKHYGIRTKRYKIMHFYDDIDTWEFYDLKNDPSELTNLISHKNYETIISTMKVKLDAVQSFYGISKKEFERASKERVERAYKQFKRLRGKPIE
mgnify:CR=1 FL=1|tara:strand:+ start:68862 stop:70520 length:1659 start_codon:yes stop_codon:yes gene_type:complete